MGFCSKNVKVVAVWEVLVVAGARWHFFCDALDQNFESLSCHIIPTRRYLFGVLKHTARYAKESNGIHKECYNVRLGASKKIGYNRSLSINLRCNQVTAHAVQLPVL